jgi:two-component system, cell cycle response regulator DivK
LAGELILIIEDNEKNRKLMRDVLRFQGYEIMEAGTAEEGIEIAQQHKPALVVMDIQLPGMDGVTALTRLRADPSTRTIPAIAATASAMPEDLQRLQNAGFESYQTKPLQVKVFTQTIRDVLNRRRDGS